MMRDSRTMHSKVHNLWTSMTVEKHLRTSSPQTGHVKLLKFIHGKPFPAFTCHCYTILYIITCLHVKIVT